MNWPHFRAIFWLRWRLSRNQMNRGGALDAVLSFLFLMGLVLASLAAGLGGIVGGFLGLAPAEGWIHLLIWDVVILVFLFFWGLSIIVELQRSEVIDFGRLMHLPVSPRHVFFINFASSHVCPPFLIAMAIAGGLTLGLIAGRGLLMLFLIPLVTGFFFMISAWTYCLRGWLTGLLMNKRRRNTALVLLVASMMLFMQLPNIYFNVIRVEHPPSGVMTLDGTSAQYARPSSLSEATLLNPSMLKTHQWMPLLWVPSGAFHLAEGRMGPALYGAVASWLIGLLGLTRAYQATIRFYLKTNMCERKKPGGARCRRRPKRAACMEWRLPWIPTQAGALSLAFLRMLFRAPEARILLVMPVLMTLLFGGIILRQPSTDLSLFLEPFLPAALTISLLFGLVQMAMNHFGFDRSGFRALMLMPVPRWQLLLAKNLSLFGVGLVLNLGLLILLAAIRGLSWDLVLAGLFQFISGFLILSILGNWASVLLPYRIAPGSIKRNRMPFKASLVILACHAVLPVLLAPILIPSLIQVWWHHFGRAMHLPISLIFSCGLLGLSLLGYHGALRSQGKLLFAREAKVLATVTTSLD